MALWVHIYICFDGLAGAKEMLQNTALGGHCIDKLAHLSALVCHGMSDELLSVNWAEKSQEILLSSTVSLSNFFSFKLKKLKKWLIISVATLKPNILFLLNNITTEKIIISITFTTAI